MPWFKVDDKLHSHMKVAEAGPAMALWVVAGSWCSDQLTDGFVPAFMCNRLMTGGADMAPALVDSGLWCEDSQDGRDGYRFRDWCDYQPTADDVQSKREAARERMRRVREDRKRTEGSTSREVRANNTRSAVRSSPNPVPVPDPTPTRKGQTLDGEPSHQDVFDRLAKVCGLDGKLTKAEGGRVAKAAKGIRPVLESVDEIDEKARAYRRKWPDLDMTPTALESNWSQLDVRQSGNATGGRRPPPVEAIS